MHGLRLSILCIILASTACAPRAARGPELDPQAAFFDAVARLCGQAFAGTVVENEPLDLADPFSGQAITMHVRDCGSDEIRIPVQVGADRSRTWVLRRVPGGLGLWHDHRHADGTPDALTMYGGTTTSRGSASRQAFPADAGSRAMFERIGLEAARANVWVLEFASGSRFEYTLERPGRRFRLAFDLARPVDPPPRASGGGRD